MPGFILTPQSDETKVKDSIHSEVTSILTYEEPEDNLEWYDTRKLAISIATHETKMGTTGIGPSTNNVCGIKRNGKFETYPSIEEGLKDCESVVLKYKPWTLKQISQRWTTTQNEEWLRNVTYFYNSN